jgi:hypothetical protein
MRETAAGNDFKPAAKVTIVSPSIVASRGKAAKASVISDSGRPNRSRAE